jgi:DNA-binding NarL/FixJ family response regulator
VIASSAKPIRVVLADDHAMVREGLKALVHSQPDMQVVGEAGDAASACQAAVDLMPDVLVLDLSMPGSDGDVGDVGDFAAAVRRRAPSVRVLVLTAHEESAYVATTLKAGVAGYLLKRAAPDDLVRAIRSVVAGGTYLDPSIAKLMVSEMFVTAASGKSSEDDGLSERERQVLIRIAQGFSNKEIAAALELSVKTVESYKRRVADKLDLRTRVDIVKYAAARGWLG